MKFASVLIAFVRWLRCSVSLRSPRIQLRGMIGVRLLLNTFPERFHLLAFSIHVDLLLKLMITLSGVTVRLSWPPAMLPCLLLLDILFAKKLAQFPAPFWLLLFNRYCQSWALPCSIGLGPTQGLPRWRTRHVASWLQLRRHWLLPGKIGAVVGPHSIRRASDEGTSKVAWPCSQPPASRLSGAGWPRENLGSPGIIVVNLVSQTSVTT